MKNTSMKNFFREMYNHSIYYDNNKKTKSENAMILHVR